MASEIVEKEVLEFEEIRHTHTEIHTDTQTDMHRLTHRHTNTHSEMGQCESYQSESTLARDHKWIP